MEIVKVCTGHFNVVNSKGEKTGISIFNGCAGMSGRGTNVYGVYTLEGKHVMVGSLQRAKRYALQLAAKIPEEKEIEGEWVPEENPDAWLDELNAKYR